MTKNSPLKAHTSTPFAHTFEKKHQFFVLTFAYIKKKQYLCTRFWKQEYAKLI